MAALPLRRDRRSGPLASTPHRAVQIHSRPAGWTRELPQPKMRASTRSFSRLAAWTALHRS
jgi:hypothetical protein